MSDADVIYRFNTHREEFVRLANIVTETPQVTSVDIEKDGSYRVSPGGLASHRIDKVVAASRTLGVLHIGVPPISGGDRYVGFILSASGLSVGGTAKSLVFSELEMDGEAVTDTDASKTVPGLAIRHRRIAEHWYIEKVSN